MELIKVYIDTNILKFSATAIRQFVPRKQTLNWGGKDHETIVHDIKDINPNENIKNADLKTEAELLPKIAEIGKQGLINLVMQDETMFESWGLPNIFSKSGRFYNAPIEIVDAPFYYERVIAGGEIAPEEMQYNFLSNIEDKRFLTLQKATGAYQGKRKPNRNQLLDAFHIWCAEHNQCAYFLTMDFKLIKVVNRSKNHQPKVKIVRPSELLQHLKELDG